MRALGFRPKALGPDGPAAHTEAVKLYESWLKVKTGGDLVVSYPAGSFGAYYERFKRTKAFARKKPRTREDYDRAWKHLGPQIWLGSEIDQLVAGAHELGHHGMAVAILIAWDTLFSPVDVYSVTKAALKRDGSGWYLERDRTKTDKGAFGALSDSTASELLKYLADLGVEVMPGARIIRRKSGNAYAEGISGKNYFAQDFREIRKHVFPKDARQFLDIRRSGNVEADAAGADKETMGELLANGLASSKFLEGTYTPPTVTKARQVALQRIEGRKRLAVEIERLSGRSKSIA